MASSISLGESNVDGIDNDMITAAAGTFSTSSEKNPRKNKTLRLGCENITKEDDKIISIMISFRKMKAKIEKDALSNIVDESTNNINTDSLLVTEDLDVDTAAAELQQIIDTLEGEFNGSSYGQMIAEVAKLECAIMKKIQLNLRESHFQL